MAMLTTPRHLKQRAEFYRELGALLGAGVPAIQALQQITKHPPSGEYRRRLFRVVGRVQGGAALWEGLEAERGWLPALDLALVRAGEESGRLVEVSRSLSGEYSDRARLIEGFVVKVLYPVLLFHFAVLIFPPEMLAGLVWRGEVGAFILQKLWVLGPVYAGVVLLVVGLQTERVPGWSSFLEALLRAVPGLGVARRELALARCAATLEALISAGVGILEAWEVAGAASGSPALQRTVRGWRGRLQAGETPAEQMSRTRFFPELFANLYSTGELSGKLDSELKHLHAYYQESGVRKLERFALAVSMVIMMGVMGGIAFWVIRFWTGYYNRVFDVLNG
jgi:type II secretory pathway component PulF